MFEEYTLKIVLKFSLQIAYTQIVQAPVTILVVFIYNKITLLYNFWKMDSEKFNSIKETIPSTYTEEEKNEIMRLIIELTNIYLDADLY